ncbi:hypothetical protein AMJ57_04855 [Parcubacteria bacterium SG8_24]|nr:MAG: hypothetical protein AMJ57_04855 [Parcubacteria bacterium SG8_24]
MSFAVSLSALLIPYALAIVFFMIFAAFNIHHLMRYGATTRVSYIITFIFLSGSVLLLFISWQMLGGVDWSQQMTFGTPFSDGSIPQL